MCDPASAAKRRTAGSTPCTRGVECFTLAWIAGLLSAFLGAGGAAALSGAALLLFAAVSPNTRRFRRELCCAALGLTLGICVWQGYDRFVRQPMLRLDGQTVTLTGTVTETAPTAGDGARCMLRTRLAGHRTEIAWFTGRDSEPFSVGDTVTLSAELTRVTADYRSRTAAYEAASGRYLRIYDAELLEHRPAAGFSLTRAAARYRSYLTERICTALPEQEAGMLCAMLFGDKTALSEPTKLSLYRTGIGHITAVSGLHLVFFCTALTWLLRRLRFSPRGVFAVNTAAVILFAMIADSAVSVYRAGIMLTLGLAAPLFHRKTDTLRSLCIAAVLCTAFTPYVIGSASFWLSVSGVFGIGIAAPYMTQGMRGRAKSFAQLCCVSAAVFPASLLLTGESSLLAPLCNLLILPFSIGALYIGLLFVCTGGLTAFLLPAAGLLCRMTAVLAGAVSRLPFSHVIFQSEAVRVMTVLAVPALLLAFALKFRPAQIAALFLSAGVLTAGLSLGVTLYASGQLRAAVLGQKNEAVLVVSSGRQTVVADLSGGVRSPQYVSRYLRDSGIRQVTLLLAGGKNAAAYQEALAPYAVSAVMIAEDVPLHSGQTVCGRQPVFLQGSAEVAAGDANMIFSGQSAEISFRGKTVAVLPADGTQPVQADAVIRWGKAGEVPADRAEISLMPASEGNNRLLTVRRDGSVSVKTLK